MPRFIRIEHTYNKEGPYTGKIAGWNLEDRDSTHRRPSPENDGGKGGWEYPRKYRYAFKDIDQLLSWFSHRELRLMCAYGFVVRVVYMYEYELLGKQVVGVIRVRGKNLNL